MELQNLRAQLVSLESERERISQQGLDTSFQDATIREVKAHIADLESQQNLELRVEQAKETGYLLDTLYSNGIPLIELSHTPENHELVAIAVQKAFLAQQDTYNGKVNEATELAEKWTAICAEKDIEIDELNAENRQLRIEKQDAEAKRNNAVSRMDEMAHELNLQADELKKLKDQLAGNVIPLAPLSVEEREAKLLAELNGNRTKVTNIRLKDENGFDTRISLANNALTGEEIEFHTIYIKRYEEISQEAAEQLRADYAAKKAEIEAQNTTIPTLEPVDIPVKELEEIAEPGPIEEVQAADDQGNTSVEGNKPLDESLGQDEQKSEVTLESLKSEVDKIKTYLGLVA